MQIGILHEQIYKLCKLVMPEEKKSELEKLYKNQIDWALKYKY